MNQEQEKAAVLAGGMRRVFTTFAEDDAKQTGDNEFEVTVYTNSPESLRHVIYADLAGMSFANYEKNPVVQFAHDSSDVPIGRTTKLVHTEEDTLKATFEFLPGDARADRVKNAWEQGFLNAASIGWWPTKTREPDEDNPNEADMWIVDEESDLVEWSIVPVPADPAALQEVHARMFSAYMKGGDGLFIPKRQARGVVFDSTGRRSGREATTVMDLRRTVDNIKREIAK